MHLIQHGDSLKQELDPTKNETIFQIPLAWLNGLVIVDTPGTNAIIREHEIITKHFVPRSDLILFLTSSDRPFTESEKEFMTKIKNWGKKIIVIVNKIDLVSVQDAKQIQKFVSEGVTNLLGITPAIFLLSARKALEKKIESSKIGKSVPLNGETPQPSTTLTPKPLTSDSDSHYDSETYLEIWKEMEDFLFKTLESEERIKIKLRSPIGVIDRVIESMSANLESGFQILRQYKVSIDVMDNEIRLYIEDMKKDFLLWQHRLDKLFLTLMERCDKFLDQNITVGNIYSLIMDKKLLGEVFQREVLADFAKELDQHFTMLTDWIIDRKFRHHKAIQEYAIKQIKVPEEKLIGSLKGSFSFNRNELILQLKQAETKSNLNRPEQLLDAKKLLEQVSNGLGTMAIIEFSALGIGSLSTFLLPTLTMEFTGIGAASFVGVMGLYVIPMKRRTLRKEFKKSLDIVSGVLKEELEKQFLLDLDNSELILKEGYSPFSRYVRSEMEGCSLNQKSLEGIKNAIDSLKVAIDNLETLKLPQL